MYLYVFRMPKKGKSKGTHRRLGHRLGSTCCYVVKPEKSHGHYSILVHTFLQLILLIIIIGRIYEDLIAQLHVQHLIRRDKNRNDFEYLEIS